MSNFTDISPKELSVLATGIAIALSEGRSADDLNVLGNLIVAIGSIMLTIAAQEQNIQSAKDAQNNAQNVK